MTAHDFCRPDRVARQFDPDDRVDFVAYLDKPIDGLRERSQIARGTVFDFLKEILCDVEAKASDYLALGFGHADDFVRSSRKVVFRSVENDAIMLNPFQVGQKCIRRPVFLFLYVRFYLRDVHWMENVV